MSAVKLSICLFGLFTLCNSLKQSPVVRPNIATFNINGSVTGIILPGYRTPFIEAFLGVPFAEPPLDQLRFSNPVPFRDFWSHDHIANTEREACLQRGASDDLNDFVTEGSEDCLYLNVFRPLGTSSDKLLPVIIKIHGGAFISGSPTTTMYGPKYFMDHGDVILVTSAYRLGPLGFLSTGDSEIPGNFALKDQAMAMRWVKENIQFFNGDPDQITIIGQSAGGASVHLHMFSPLSRDLFNRIAAGSGSAIAPFANVNDDPLSLARRVAQEIGIVNYDTLTTAELAIEFKLASARDILAAGHIFHVWLGNPTVVFRPVVEEDSPDAFLIEDPRISIANGNYKVAPLLMTIVPEEGVVSSGTILTNDAEIDSLNSNFNAAIGAIIDFQQDDPDTESKIDKLVDFYFNGTRNIGWHNAQRFTDMCGDRMFHYPFYATYKFHSKTVDPLRNPLYLMEFNYRGPYSLSYLYTQTSIDFGVVHGDDLLYLVDNIYFPPFTFDSVEARLIVEMVDIYVNFAYGRSPHEKSTVCVFEEAEPDKPCDYLYIGHSEDGYKVVTSTETDFDIINLWRDIDKLF